MLAYLRELQRRHAVAVLVVHHARKGGGSVRAGQALRGSSEFHAWGDSNLYLRRDGDDLSLCVEHRAAPSAKPMRIELTQRGDALALEVVEQPVIMTPAPPALDARIMAALADAEPALPFAKLRERCRVRAATLSQRLAALAAEGRLIKALPTSRSRTLYSVREREPESSCRWRPAGASILHHVVVECALGAGQDHAAVLTAHARLVRFTTRTTIQGAIDAVDRAIADEASQPVSRHSVTSYWSPPKVGQSVLNRVLPANSRLDLCRRVRTPRYCIRPLSFDP